MRHESGKAARTAEGVFAWDIKQKKYDQPADREIYCKSYSIHQRKGSWIDKQTGEPLLSEMCCFGGAKCDLQEAQEHE